MSKNALLVPYEDFIDINKNIKEHADDFANQMKLARLTSNNDEDLFKMASNENAHHVNIYANPNITMYILEIP